jgi:integrase
MSDHDGDTADTTPTPKKAPKKMKGIRERYPGSFSIIIELGYETDATGKPRRRQKWVNFRATPGLSLAAQRKEAEAYRIKLLGDKNAGTFMEPSKVTLLEWLRSWLATSIAPPMKRPATHRAYQVIVETHIAKSSIALTALQRLRASDLERYLAGVGAGSVALHAAVLHSALKKATRDRLLTTSPADHLEYQHVPRDHAAIRAFCWSATEARRFIEAAMTAGGQIAAYLLLALDSGARKSELNGIGWQHVNFDTGVLTIERQLDAATTTTKKTRAVVFDAATAAPVFGPTKTKNARTVALGPDTLDALRTHRRQQLELRLKNGQHYLDFGLVFAKEDADLQTPTNKLGQAIQTLSETAFQRVTAAAGVRPIKFHGLRHTCATLLLQAGVPPHVVAGRLGHSTQMLLSTYAHALPDQQADAASRLAGLLRG